jgi:hypothetical protein
VQELAEKWVDLVQESKNATSSLKPGYKLTLDDWHKIYDNAFYLFCQAGASVSLPSPIPVSIVEQLKEIRNAFQWTFDNMGTPHTSDHFNVPANGITEVDMLIELIEAQPAAVPDVSVLTDALEKVSKYGSSNSDAIEDWAEMRTIASEALSQFNTSKQSGKGNYISLSAAVNEFLSTIPLDNGNNYLAGFGIALDRVRQSLPASKQDKEDKV